MPYKDIDKRRENQRNWLRRKRAGIDNNGSKMACGIDTGDRQGIDNSVKSQIDADGNIMPEYV